LIPVAKRSDLRADLPPIPFDAELLAEGGVSGRKQRIRTIAANLPTEVSAAVDYLNSDPASVYTYEWDADEAYDSPGVLHLSGTPEPTLLELDRARFARLAGVNLDGSKPLPPYSAWSGGLRPNKLLRTLRAWVASNNGALRLCPTCRRFFIAQHGHQEFCLPACRPAATPMKRDRAAYMREYRQTPQVKKRVTRSKRRPQAR
jgi:hypothetical protein